MPAPHDRRRASRDRGNMRMCGPTCGPTPFSELRRDPFIAAEQQVAKTGFGEVVVTREGFVQVHSHRRSFSRFLGLVVGEDERLQLLIHVGKRDSGALAPAHLTNRNRGKCRWASCNWRRFYERVWCVCERSLAFRCAQRSFALNLYHDQEAHGSAGLG